MAQSIRQLKGQEIYSIADVADYLGLEKRTVNREVEYFLPDPRWRPQGVGRMRKEIFILLDDGTAFDLRTDKRYNCREVAELVHLAKEEYEPWVRWQADEPAIDKWYFVHGRRFEEDLLEMRAKEILVERGISEETQDRFRIGTEVNIFTYPTWHVNGNPGCFRNKAFNFAAPTKYWWSKRGVISTKGRPPLVKPFAYNAWGLHGRSYVCLVSGEVDVWTLFELNEVGICAFESRPDYLILMQTLKGIGIEKVYVLLKNDDLGHENSARANAAAIEVGLQCQVRVLSGTAGLDINQLYLQCDQDREKFQRSLREMPTADVELLQAWTPVDLSSPSAATPGEGVSADIVIPDIDSEEGRQSSSSPEESPFLIADLSPGLDLYPGLESSPARRFTAQDLLAMDIPEPQWVIPDFLAAGLGVFAGNVKMHKSWMCLDIAVAVASGGVVWDLIPVTKGEVLYLSLEDNQRQVQDRLRRILGNAYPPTGLDIWLECPRLDEGGLEHLETWLAQHANCRLMVIDGFEKVRPPAESGSQSSRGNSDQSDSDQSDSNQGGFSKTKAKGSAPDFLRNLKSLSAKYGTAILLVHHLDESGSTKGKGDLLDSRHVADVADTIWVLSRERGEASASLTVTGRDVSQQSLPMHWDEERFRWTRAQERDPVGVPLSQERQEVLRVLEKSRVALKPKAIAQGVKKKEGAIRKLLRSMAEDRQIIQPARGLYISRARHQTEGKTRL